MTGIGRRALFKAGAAITPGLGRPAPSRPPYPGRPAPGGAPATRQVVRAQQVIVSGPDDGVFVYSGTPAAGNLIASNASAAGNDAAWTSGAGNTYLAGNVTYEAIGPRSTMAALQQTGIALQCYTAPSPSGTYALVQELFFVVDTSTGLHQLALGGVSGASISFESPVTTMTAIEPGTSAAAETWHPMTLAKANGWAVNASYNTPQYRLLPDGNVQFSGLASRAPFTTTIALNPGEPLPDAYRPSKIKAVCQGSPLGSRARVEFHSDGILYAVGTTLFRTTAAELEATVSIT